jgi:two-component system cell cycle sensor histidine kinase PleC
LISNAIKFTRPGGEVRVFARALPTGGCETGVSDTGVGIPPEAQVLVFRPFVQVSSARDAREGTGLGLPLVQRLAEMHGARVNLVSELMRGTTVRVVWPHERMCP